MKPALALLALAMPLVLSACATVPPGPQLPSMRYAKGLSAGGPAAAVLPRPAQADVQLARTRWREGMGQVLACRLPAPDAIRTSVAGAVELATMSAVADGGLGEPSRKLLGQYAKELVEQAISPGPRPSAARCAHVARWSAQVRKEGQAAVGRAIARGFIPLL